MSPCRSDSDHERWFAHFVELLAVVSGLDIRFDPHADILQTTVEKLMNDVHFTSSIYVQIKELWSDDGKNKHILPYEETRKVLGMPLRPHKSLKFINENNVSMTTSKKNKKKQTLLKVALKPDKIVLGLMLCNELKELIKELAVRKVYGDDAVGDVDCSVFPRGVPLKDVYDMQRVVRAKDLYKELKENPAFVNDGPEHEAKQSPEEEIEADAKGKKKKGSAAKAQAGNKGKKGSGAKEEASVMGSSTEAGTKSKKSSEEQKESEAKDKKSSEHKAETKTKKSSEVQVVWALCKSAVCTCSKGPSEAVYAIWRGAKDTEGGDKELNERLMEGGKDSSEQKEEEAAKASVGSKAVAASGSKDSAGSGSKAGSKKNSHPSKEAEANNGDWRRGGPIPTDIMLKLMDQYLEETRLE